MIKRKWLNKTSGVAYNYEGINPTKIQYCVIITKIIITCSLSRRPIFQKTFKVATFSFNRMCSENWFVSEAPYNTRACTIQLKKVLDVRTTRQNKIIVHSLSIVNHWSSAQVSTSASKRVCSLLSENRLLLQTSNAEIL